MVAKVHHRVSAYRQRELQPDLESLQRWAPPSHRVPREGEQIDGPSHVVVVAVPLQRDVISEPLCLFIGIRVAATQANSPEK
jgi:hypothetical protein